MRLTIRLRLTLLYAGLFVVCAAGLVAVNYGALRESAGRPVNNSGSVVVNETVTKARSTIMSTALRVSLLGFGLLTITSLGVGWVIAGRVLQPVREITATARRASNLDLGARVELAGPGDELKELADTMDGLLARLHAAYDVQRRFAANASHELRTPLSLMRTSIDVALASPRAGLDRYRLMARELREAALRAERLVDGMLLLAQCERRDRAAVAEPCDLADAAAVALQASASELGAAGLRVVLALAPAPVAGERALLERMVANLVENGIRHNAGGGLLEVSTGAVGRRAFVQVRNDGEPIAAEALPRLFEPFRRLRGDRVGSDRGAGLGLSIVEAVAAAHGGEVDARPRLGGGLEVMVVLPVTSVAAGAALVS